MHTFDSQGTSHLSFIRSYLTVMYAVKVVGVYKIQYEHINEVWWAV